MIEVARVAVVLQVRLGSTRLFGKALQTLAGQSLLSHCVTRLCSAAVGPVVVATTIAAEDDGIARHAAELGAEVFRGDRDDVLGRVLKAGISVDADIVVRATGDNPAVDIGTARRAVSTLRKHSADHVVEAELPCGAAAEAVTRVALERADRRAVMATDREHVTTFIKRDQRLFRCLQPFAPPALCRPDLRLTVDTPSDLAYMHRVLARAEPKGGIASLRRIILAADELERESVTSHRHQSRCGDIPSTASDA